MLFVFITTDTRRETTRKSKTIDKFFWSLLAVVPRFEGIYQKLVFQKAVEMCPRVQVYPKIKPDLSVMDDIGNLKYSYSQSSKINKNNRNAAKNNNNNSTNKNKNKNTNTNKNKNKNKNSETFSKSSNSALNSKSHKRVNAGADESPNYTRRRTKSITIYNPTLRYTENKIRRSASISTSIKYQPEGTLQDHEKYQYELIRPPRLGILSSFKQHLCKDSGGKSLGVYNFDQPADEMDGQKFMTVVECTSTRKESTASDEIVKFKTIPHSATSLSLSKLKKWAQNV